MPFHLSLLGPGLRERGALLIPAELAHEKRETYKEVLPAMLAHHGGAAIRPTPLEDPGAGGMLLRNP